MEFQKTIIEGPINFYLDYVDQPFEDKSDFSHHVHGKITPNRLAPLDMANLVAEYLSEKLFVISEEVNWISKTNSSVDGNYDVGHQNRTPCHRYCV